MGGPGAGAALMLVARACEGIDQALEPPAFL